MAPRKCLIFSFVRRRCQPGRAGILCCELAQLDELMLWGLQPAAPAATPLAAGRTQSKCGTALSWHAPDKTESRTAL
ncbi:hypothetical protein H8959_022452 [Pygathrix nigripes]